MAILKEIVVPVRCSWKSISILSACVFLIGITAGLSGGWVLWHPEKTVVEKYKPEVRKPDGSLVLERRPSPGLPPPHKIDNGYHLERIVEVTAQGGKKTDTTSRRSVIAYKDTVHIIDTIIIRETCQPVTVALTVQRHPKGGIRVQASSPDGQILSGVDIPVDQPPEAARPRKWAAGVCAGYQPITSLWAVGAAVERDIGPFRLGVNAMGGKYWSVGALVGIRF